MSDDFPLCPNCGSAYLIDRFGDDEPTIHYGRTECGECGRWIMWLTDPKVDEQVKAKDTAINELLTHYKESLSEWDKTFLQSNLDKRHVSPRQKLQLHRIYEKCTNIPYFDDDELAELNEAQKYAPSMKVRA